MLAGVDSFFWRVFVTKQQKVEILTIYMGILLPNLLLWTVAPGLIKICGILWFLLFAEDQYDMGGTSQIAIVYINLFLGD